MNTFPEENFPVKIPLLRSVGKFLIIEKNHFYNSGSGSYSSLNGKPGFKVTLPTQKEVFLFLELIETLSQRISDVGIGSLDNQPLESTFANLLCDVILKDGVYVYPNMNTLETYYLATAKWWLGSSEKRLQRPEVNGLTSYSWTIESEDVAHKVLDKSGFLHLGTGIPIAIRPFFIDHELVPGEKRSITLLHQGVEYPAHVDLETSSTSRTRLFWNNDFSRVMKTSFPHHYKQYSENLEPDTKLILRFHRVNGFKEYQVSFAGEVAESTLIKAIEAEEIEDKGPMLEGRVKQYFGKRYERNPVNRQKAIRYHGLACNVCGFNFEEVYGERGSGYIEVHHVKPISTYDGEQPVDPKTDLTTVCSNCHRMIHRDPNEVLTIQQAQAIIRAKLKYWVSKRQ